MVKKLTNPYNAGKSREYDLYKSHLKKIINFPLRTIDKRSLATRRFDLIFYTIKGPTSKLEIYSDKIKLIKKRWLQLFTKKDQVDSWQINELSEFEIKVPKFFIFSGKIEWTTFNGQKGTFRFSTNAHMTKKIEVYLQKRIQKNYHRQGKNNKDQKKMTPELPLKAA